MANIVELRDMTTEDLRNLLEENRAEMFNLRFQKATGSLENTSRLKVVQREIAQLNELIGKRMWAIEEAANHADVAPLLEGKEWSGDARYDYEDGVWIVNLVDDDEEELASVMVDLNKKRRRTRRQRDNILPVQKVVDVEVSS